MRARACLLASFCKLRDSTPVRAHPGTKGVSCRGVGILADIRDRTQLIMYSEFVTRSIFQARFAIDPRTRSQPFT